MKILLLISIGLAGIAFGALIMFAMMKLINFHKAKMADLAKRIGDLEKQIEGKQLLAKRIDDLEKQIKDKQLPFYVRDGLEEIKALENADLFDLARMRLYLEEATKTVDQAADRQTKMGAIYSALRNHRKSK